ncbi:MAG TPA: hypothetical protein P5172_03705 [Syntrophales bacterium]|nr:hypothetical protein [Syntrophales bacterium]
MRKFWVILLSLGLIMAFAMPAAAVDVKFSGLYYAMGWYVDNHSGLDKDQLKGAADWGGETQHPTQARETRSMRGPNAFYAQRFRLQPEFQIVEGLKLVTRFDAMEKRWGDQAWAGATGETQSRTQTPLGSPDPNGVRRGAGTVKAQENLEWERAYLDFNVPFGKFQVGYMQFLTWGTDFLNTPLSAGGIRYYFSQGPWMAVAAIEKRAEWVGLNAGNIGVANDADRDVYDLGVIYKFKPGEAGILYQYSRSSGAKWGQDNGYLTSIMGLYPYTKLTFGNFFIEAEGIYGWGDLRSYESTTRAATQGAPRAGQDLTNVGLSVYGAFVHAKYDWKPAYIGAQFVYISGDDNDKPDKVTGSVVGALQGNYGFNRALILWNSDYGDNLGAMQGNIAGVTANRRTGANYMVNQFMDNVWFYQLYLGVKPTPKMDFKVALSLANADKKPKSDVGVVGSPGYYSAATVREFDSAKYGTELDVTGSYKIYDNLTYMVGFGYLWVGDYFRGYDVDAKVKDNYLLTHRLTLNF